MNDDINNSTADNNIANTSSEIQPMRILKIATCPSLSGRSTLNRVDARLRIDSCPSLQDRDGLFGAPSRPP